MKFFFDLIHFFFLHVAFFIIKLCHEITSNSLKMTFNVALILKLVSNLVHIFRDVTKFGIKHLDIFICDWVIFHVCFFLHIS